MASRSVGSIIASLKADSLQFQKAFQEAEKQVTRTTKKIQQDTSAMNKSLATVSTVLKTLGVGVSVGAAIQGIRSMGSALLDIQDKAKQAGVSAEAIQAYDFYARENNTTLEKMVDTLAKVKQKTLEAMAQPKGEAANVFKRLAIDVQEFNAVADKDKLPYLMQRVQGATDQTTAFGLATKLMGEQAIRSKEALLGLAAGYNKIEADARKAGQVVTEEGIAAVDRLNKSWERFKQGALVGVEGAAGLLLGDLADPVQVQRIENLFNLIGKEAPENVKLYAKVLRDMKTRMDDLKAATEAANAAFTAQVAAVSGLDGDYEDKLEKLLQLAYVGSPTPEQTAQALAAIEQLKDANEDLIKKLVEGTKTAADKWEEIHQVLKDGVAIGRLTEDQYRRIYEYYNPAVKEAAEATKKLTEEQERQNKALQDRAAALKASVRTPEEIHRDNMLETERLYADGKIDATTYERLATKYDGELATANNKGSMAGFAKEVGAWQQQWDPNGDGSATKKLEELRTQLEANTITMEEYKKAVEETQVAYESFGYIGDSLRDGLEEIAGAVVTNFRSVGDVVKQVIMKIIQQMIMLKVIGGFGATFGGSGAGTGLLGSIGNLFGGKTPAANANGGFLPANDWSVVGERGPELVNFSSPARIYSNEDSAAMGRGGSRTLVWSPTIYASDVPTMAAYMNSQKAQWHQDFYRMDKRLDGRR